MTVRTPRLQGCRAVTACAAVSVALSLAGGPVGPAHAVSPSAESTSVQRAFTVRHLSVVVRVGPRRDHRCTVVANLYRPAGVSRANKAPAILTTNGFGGSKDDADQRAIGRGFARAGYVVLSYSGLGFGGSGCKIHLDNPAWDGAAGRQLVSVLAGTKPARLSATGRRIRVHYVATNGRQDPRVGMIGGSYGGEVQFAVAEQDHRVDALVPLITWNDLSYSLAPNNTAFRTGVTSRTPGVFKREWTAFFFGLGIVDGVTSATVDPSRDQVCPNFVDQACVSVAQLAAQGYPDAATRRLARHASVASYIQRVTAPTLLAQGQNDTLFNLAEATATFRALRRQGTPVRMVWQSWGHSGGGTPAPGELTLSGGGIRHSFLGRRFLHWMNHYVRGRTQAPVGPRFSYFRDWVRYDTRPGHADRAVARAYADRDRLGIAPNTRLYLSGTDRLVRHRDRVVAGSASYANAAGAPTSYSETSALEGTYVHHPPSDAPGTFAAWTTRRLTRPTVVVGMPRLTLHLSAPVARRTQRLGPDGKLVLFAKIYDVAPDGSVRLHRRLVSPVRVRDVTRPVRVELPGVVQRFRAGHRIRVVLAASDAAYSGNAAVQPVTVRTSPAHPSTLALPLTRPLRLR